MAERGQERTVGGSPPLKVVLVSDGIAGHFRQSEGIVAALRRRHSVDLARIDLPKQSGAWRFLLAFAARRLPGLMPLSWYIGPGHGATKVDIVVSAGGRTLAANTVLRHRISGARSIFSGSPRRFGAKAFDLVLLSYPAPPEKGVYILKPTALDPDGLPRPATNADHARPLRIAVLIGGPTEPCPFTADDWDSVLSLLRALGERADIRLLPVTSRRTPPAWADDLNAVARSLPGIERVIDYRTAGLGSIAAAFETDALIVTADSMSMVTEGVAARRPVVVLNPAAMRPSRDDATMEDLTRQGRIARIRLDGNLNAQAVFDALSACRPMTENHLDRLADVLESVVPPREKGVPAAFGAV